MSHPLELAAVLCCNCSCYSRDSSQAQQHPTTERQENTHASRSIVYGALEQQTAPAAARRSSWYLILSDILLMLVGNSSTQGTPPWSKDIQRLAAKHCLFRSAGNFWSFVPHDSTWCQPDLWAEANVTSECHIMSVTSGFKIHWNLCWNLFSESWIISESS